MMRFGSVRHRVMLAALGGFGIDEGVHHGGWMTLITGIVAVVIALAYNSDRPERPPPKSFGERVLFYFGLR